MPDVAQSLAFDGQAWASAGTTCCSSDEPPAHGATILLVPVTESTVVFHAVEQPTAGTNVFSASCAGGCGPKYRFDFWTVVQRANVSCSPLMPRTCMVGSVLQVPADLTPPTPTSSLAW